MEIERARQRNKEQGRSLNYADAKYVCLKVKRACVCRSSSTRPNELKIEEHTNSLRHTTLCWRHRAPLCLFDVFVHFRPSDRNPFLISCVGPFCFGQLRATRGRRCFGTSIFYRKRDTFFVGHLSSIQRKSPSVIWMDIIHILYSVALGSNERFSRLEDVNSSKITAPKRTLSIAFQCQMTIEWCCVALFCGRTHVFPLRAGIQHSFNLFSNVSRLCSILNDEHLLLLFFSLY